MPHFSKIIAAATLLSPVHLQADQLELASKDKGDALLRAEANGVVMELEGKEVAASATFTPEEAKEGAEPIIVVPLEGDYKSSGNGVLRLQFGEATPPPAKSGKLIAFWKFDEPKGDSAADLKAEKQPATIIGGDPEKERPVGVGFGEVHSLPLGANDYVETKFVQRLDGNNSICMWTKTTKAGVLLSKVESKKKGYSPGSRSVHIGEDGLLVAYLGGPAGSTLKGKTSMTDDKWHHFAWVTRPALHELYVDGKLEASTEPGAGAVGGNPSPLLIGSALDRPKKFGDRAALPSFEGTIDNIRIYDFALNERQIEGFYLVGSKRAPIIITSEPQKTIRVGETFNYSVEFTGAPYVQFRFIGLPDWLKFEGRITGTPTIENLGLSKRITITGICPWGPAQQEFKLNVLPALISEQWQFSIDGKAIPYRRVADGIEVDLPDGEGRWSFAKKKDEPPKTP